METFASCVRNQAHAAGKYCDSRGREYPNAPKKKEPPPVDCWLYPGGSQKSGNASYTCLSYSVFLSNGVDASTPDQTLGIRIAMTSSDPRTWRTFTLRRKAAKRLPPSERHVLRISSKRSQSSKR